MKNLTVFTVIVILLITLLPDNLNNKHKDFNSKNIKSQYCYVNGCEN